jgi:hypothetical protein
VMVKAAVLQRPDYQGLEYGRYIKE